MTRRTTLTLDSGKLSDGGSRKIEKPRIMATQKEKTKILVIDDERLIRLTLNAKLKQIGYTAVSVASIPEAVVLLNDGGYKQFKAIITDIMMGDMDGFVFRDIVRGMDESMPIFFMTALDHQQIRWRTEGSCRYP